MDTNKNQTFKFENGTIAKNLGDSRIYGLQTLNKDDLTWRRWDNTVLGFKAVNERWEGRSA